MFFPFKVIQNNFDLKIVKIDLIGYAGFLPVVADWHN